MIGKKNGIVVFGMGSSNHTAKWVSYFRDQGYRVMLISFHPCRHLDGVQIEYLKVNGRLGMLAKLPRIKTLIKDFAPDLIHAHYASSYGLVASLTGFSPFVLSTWGDDIMVFPRKSVLHRAIIGRVIRRADYLTATSKMLGEATLDVAGVRKEIDIIPFGVDLQRFAAVDRPQREPIHIGAVRWLTPKYGIDYLIRAVAQLIEERLSVKLTIIGLGPLRQELELLARQLGVEDQVTFTGPISNEEVIDYLNKFDIAVMPSTSEGETFGVAAVEAMATGLPVVASNIGGLPEVVLHDVTGKLVKPSDVGSLAAALREYVNSHALRIKHGLAGRRRAEELFDWSRNADSMGQLYSRILDSRNQLSD